MNVGSAWGETLASTSVLIAAGSAADPWSYELDDLPAFNKLKVSVAFEPKGVPASYVTGESALFELKPSGTATVNVQTKN